MTTQKQDARVAAMAATIDALTASRDAWRSRAYELETERAMQQDRACTCCGLSHVDLVICAPCWDNR